jgi:hypothetical protein
MRFLTVHLIVCMALLMVGLLPVRLLVLEALGGLVAVVARLLGLLLVVPEYLGGSPLVRLQNPLPRVGTVGLGKDFANVLLSVRRGRNVQQKMRGWGGCGSLLCKGSQGVFYGG